MRLTNKLDIYLSSTTIKRKPSWLDTFISNFTEINLETNQAKITLGSMALMEQFEECFKKNGITNAILLKIDDQVLFHDKDAVENDLDFMVTALSEHTRIFSEDFKKIDLVMEHSQSGIHTLFDIRLSRIHPKNKPPITIHVAGRIQELQPNPTENTETYRTRIQQLLSTPGFLDSYQAIFSQFMERFVQRLSVDLRAEKIELTNPLITVKRPSNDEIRHAAKTGFTAESPRIRDSFPKEYTKSGPYYDPHDRYYWSPFDTLLSVFAISMFMNAMIPMAAIPVHFADTNGQWICDSQTIGEHTQDFAGMEEAAHHNFDQPSEDIPGMDDWDSADGYSSDFDSGDTSIYNTNSYNSDSDEWGDDASEDMTDWGDDFGEDWDSGFDDGGDFGGFDF